MDFDVVLKSFSNLFQPLMHDNEFDFCSELSTSCWCIHAMSLKKPAAKRAREPEGSSIEESPNRPHPSEEQRPLQRAGWSDWSSLWYGSDCSGLDAGAIAIHRVAGGDARHWFGSEVHPPYKSIFQKIHPNCEKCFDDVSKRSNDELAAERRANPDAFVVYTAGFPCQPFARDGKKRGAEDPRASVMYDVLATIEAIRPTTFLLENVKDLAVDKRYREVFKDLIEILVAVGGGVYYIDYQVLDSVNYGVPATRPRVYVVGVLKKQLRSSWKWPKPLNAPKTLTSILVARRKGEKQELESLNNTALGNLDKAYKKIKESNKSTKGPWVVDLGNSQSRGLNMAYDRFPCITKSHADKMWLMSKQDFAKPVEVLAAQGIQQSDLPVKIDALPPAPLYQMVGNSFTVPVVQAILDNVLEAAGFFENL